VRQLLKSRKVSGKAAWAALLIGAILFLTAAAPCASLHHRLHEDVRGAGHACFLCMMMQGQMDCAAPAPVQDSFVSVLIGLTPAVNSARIVQADLRLSPSRAPPRR
jgi:hypothetical protein